jgi:hypothetical protein
MRPDRLASFLTPLTLLVLACLVSIAYHFYVRSHLIGLLRDRHPDTWQILGRPSLLSGFLTSGLEFIPLLHWLWLRKEKSLKDPELLRAASLHRCSQIVPFAILFTGGLLAAFGQFDFLLWHI